MNRIKPDIQLFVMLFLVMFFLAISAFTIDKMMTNPAPVTPKKVVSIIKEAYKGPPKQTYKKYVPLRKDKYELHREMASSFGIPVIDNETVLKKYISNGKLQRIQNSQGYKIHDLTYSKPYLNASAKKTLQEIGVAFSHTAGYGQYFMVTSLVRTHDSQKALTRTNVNATRGISSHSYGASFDISYIRFNGIKGDNSKLRSMLESILYDMQQQGKIYVLVERRSACYHITPRN